MSKFDRKAAKKKLLNRTREQNAKKDQGQYGTIFKRSDLPMASFENGKHKFDIIPYLAGKHDPNVPKGEPTYLLDIWVHRKVGPGGDPYICLAKNYKQNCPVCNYRKEYEDELDEDELDALRPKRRSVYNVVVRDTEEERKKGVQILEISHHFMEKNILPQAENPDTGGVVAFSDPEEGMTIYFKRSGTKDKQVWDGHKLLPRDYKISDKILDQAFTLDELVHVPTEEELEKVVKGLKKKGKDRDEDEEEIEDDEEETTTKRKKSKSKKDEEEDVDDSDFEDDDEDEEEEEKPKSKKKKQSADDDEDEEEEDDEEDEEDEKPKKKGKGGKGKCPEGGTFGEDFDKFDGCVDCSNFDDCSDTNDELEEKKSKKKKKKPIDDDEDDEEEKPKKKKKPVDDDDDDGDDDGRDDGDGDNSNDDEEDEEEEEEKPKKKKSKFNRRTGR